CRPPRVRRASLPGPPPLGRPRPGRLVSPTVYPGKPLDHPALQVTYDQFRGWNSTPPRGRRGTWAPDLGRRDRNGHATRPADLVFVPTSACRGVRRFVCDYCPSPAHEGHRDPVRGRTYL